MITGLAEICFLPTVKNGIILDYSQGKTEVKCRQYQPDNMIGTAYFVSKNDSEHQMSHFIDRLGDVFKVQIVLYIVSFIGKVLINPFPGSLLRCYPASFLCGSVQSVGPRAP